MTVQYTFIIEKFGLGFPSITTELLTFCVLGSEALTCDVVQRWVRAFYGDIVHTNITTTNGLERQHEELKYNYLNNCSNGSLTDLVTAVVTRFVPDSRSK